MFTSRAEHRLLLRIDNADLRLTSKGRQVGLVDDERWQRFEDRVRRYTTNLCALEHTLVRTAHGDRVPASQWLKQPGNTLAPLVDSGGIALDVAETSRELDLASVETTLKYEGYLKQEASRAARLRREEKRRIPEGVVFAAIPGLSREVVQRLSQVRPETLGQASRIPGMTPAAIAVLGSFLGRHEADSSSHA